MKINLTLSPVAKRTLEKLARASGVSASQLVEALIFGEKNLRESVAEAQASLRKP